MGRGRRGERRGGCWSWWRPFAKLKWQRVGWLLGWLEGEERMSAERFQVAMDGSQRPGVRFDPTGNGQSELHAVPLTRKESTGPTRSGPTSNVQSRPDLTVLCPTRFLVLRPRVQAKSKQQDLDQEGRWDSTFPTSCPSLALSALRQSRVRTSTLVLWEPTVTASLPLLCLFSSPLDRLQCEGRHSPVLPCLDSLLSCQELGPLLPDQTDRVPNGGVRSRPRRDPNAPDRVATRKGASQKSTRATPSRDRSTKRCGKTGKGQQTSWSWGALLDQSRTRGCAFLEVCVWVVPSRDSAVVCAVFCRACVSSSRAVGILGVGCVRPFGWNNRRLDSVLGILYGLFFPFPLLLQCRGCRLCAGRQTGGRVEVDRSGRS